MNIIFYPYRMSKGPGFPVMKFTWSAFPEGMISSRKPRSYLERRSQERLAIIPSTKQRIESKNPFEVLTANQTHSRNLSSYVPNLTLVHPTTPKISRQGVRTLNQRFLHLYPRKLPFMLPLVNQVEILPCTPFDFKFCS